MTDLQRFNRCWLCHAMTAPVKGREQNSHQRRGFDSKVFFNTFAALKFSML